MSIQWYVVHTSAGFEEKVKATLLEKAERLGLADEIPRILVPVEKVIEVRGGKKREADRKFYPGYILIQMNLNDRTWHAVKSIPRVTGFVGGTSPTPLPEEEVELILQQMERGPVAKVDSSYQKGEAVRITDGPFMNFNGYVDIVDVEHGKLRVMVSIFGRQTPVELSFYQVERSS